jgi:plasmid stability protein
MPNITVRNIPDEVHKLLQQTAARHGRSLNGELLDILDREAQMAERGLEISHEVLEHSPFQRAPQQVSRNVGRHRLSLAAANGNPTTGKSRRGR